MKIHDVAVRYLAIAYLAANIYAIVRYGLM